MEDNNQKNTNQNDEEGVTKNNPSELEMCKKQAEEYLNNWKRERADFVNYKREEAKRMGEFVKFASEDILLSLLAVLDDFYTAAREVKNEGLDQTVRKLEELLKKYGIEKITVAGEKFDPLKHEAIESEDGGERLEEISAGYTMYGKIIRAARVKIIK